LVLDKKLRVQTVNQSFCKCFKMSLRQALDRKVYELGNGHLSSRIPNCNLEKCNGANPLFQSVKCVTLFLSFKSLTFRLWDEQRRKLVGFGTQ